MALPRLGQAMPAKPSRSASCASSRMAARLPGDATRDNAGREGSATVGHGTRWVATRHAIRSSRGAGSGGHPRLCRRVPRPARERPTQAVLSAVGATFLACVDVCRAWRGKGRRRRCRRWRRGRRLRSRGAHRTGLPVQPHGAGRRPGPGAGPGSRAALDGSRGAGARALRRPAPGVVRHPAGQLHPDRGQRVGGAPGPRRRPARCGPSGPWPTRPSTCSTSMNRWHQGPP